MMTLPYRVILPLSGRQFTAGLRRDATARRRFITPLPRTIQRAEAPMAAAPR